MGRSHHDHLSRGRVYGLRLTLKSFDEQILNICETFDLKVCKFQSAASIHHQAEAKRLAFEPGQMVRRHRRQDAGRMAQSKTCRERARRANPTERTAFCPAMRFRRHHLFNVAVKDGMIQLDQSNYRGMGSGLVPDGADSNT
jgi:gamma-glutamyltranspeptidase/glutathione hydrolase